MGLIVNPRPFPDSCWPRPSTTSTIAPPSLSSHKGPIEPRWFSVRGSPPMQLKGLCHSAQRWTAREKGAAGLRWGSIGAGLATLNELHLGLERRQLLVRQHRVHRHALLLRRRFPPLPQPAEHRSEEHTSELQSLRH